MREYFRRFIFTLTPLKKGYKFQDIFQVVPFEVENSPKSSIANHFPAFLEFWVEKDQIGDSLDKLAFTENYLDEIINLLSSLSNHRFFRYHQDYNSWRIEYPEVDYKNLSNDQKDFYTNQTSKWSSSIFMYPGFGNDQMIKSFSEFKDGVNINPAYHYFTYNPVEYPNGEIEFPDTMANSITKYFELKTNEKEKVRSVIKLINQGLEIATRMRSLGFLAYVSSIETLVNLEYSEVKVKFKCNTCKSIDESPFTCNECGNPVWGIGTKFYSFLGKYVSKTEGSLKKFKKIYGIRSKITHAGELMLADLDMTFAKMDKKELDHLILLETRQLARISLTFWLVKK
jgi:hypothetical protein